MRKITTIAVVTSIMVGISIPNVAIAAEVKGSICSKLNTQKIVDSQILKCTKKGSKKVWIYKGSAYSTPGNPAPMATGVVIGDGRFSVIGSGQPGQQTICMENGFNPGCKYDDNLRPVPDPAFDKVWWEFLVDVENLSNKIYEPYFADIGVVANGKIYWQGIFGQPVLSGDRIRNFGLVTDLSLLPKSSTEEIPSLYALLPMGLKPTQLVLRPNSFSKEMYFFSLALPQE